MTLSPNPDIGGIIGVGLYGGTSQRFSLRQILAELKVINPGSILLFESALDLAQPIRAQHPNAFIYGRWWVDKQTDAYLEDPQGSAMTLAEMCLNHPSNKYLNGWQSLNESYTGGQERCQKVAAFDGYFAAYMEPKNRWALVGNIAVGNPPDDNDIKYLAPVLKRRNTILLYHAYSHRRHPNEAYTVFRYRRWLPILAAEGVHNPRIMLGEIGHEPGGWRRLGVSCAQYVTDMRWWAVGWRADGIIGTNIFTFRDNDQYDQKDPDDHGWDNFDIMGETKLVKGLGRINANNPHPLPILPYPYQQQEEEPQEAPMNDYYRDQVWAIYQRQLAQMPAFQKFRAGHGELGDPIGRTEKGVPLEFDRGQYRLSLYAGGIVYAKIGDWGNVKIATTMDELPPDELPPA